MNRLLSCCAIFLVLASGLTPVQRSWASAVPRFDPAPCPFKPRSGFQPGRNLRCGYLIVPEDRTVATSPTIRLAVAIFKTPSTHRRSDPVVFLQGGPGGSIVGGLAASLTGKSAQPILGNHDLILLDQRGTGYSRPNLDCPEDTHLQYRLLSRDYPIRRQNALDRQAVATCHARLVGAGVNLAAFNTEEDAADVADLRTALGYRQVDLYGVSYGTRVALAVMRLHPQGIRSVVLDSVVAPRYNIFYDPLRSMQRVFEVVFSGCAQSKSCSTDLPDVRGDFYHLVAQLDAHPLTFPIEAYSTGRHYRFVLTGYGLATMVFTTLYATSLISYLPRLILELKKGQTRTAAVLAGLLLVPRGDIQLGDFLSMACADDGPWTTLKRIRAAATVLPDPLQNDEVDAAYGGFRLCSIWHVPATNPAQRQPVTSSIPTLVLAGEYDPVTPPANGQRVARTLANSYFVQVPATGHGVFLTGRCAISIYQTFLDQPRTRPDTGCLSSISPPFGRLR